MVYLNIFKKVSNVISINSLCEMILLYSNIWNLFAFSKVIEFIIITSVIEDSKYLDLF